VPAIGWLFLRRASLGRAIGETASGTLIGITIGALFHTATLFALLGFLIAAGRLWAATRPAAARDLDHAI